MSMEWMPNAMEWQPIETAPKDGTDILVAGINFGEVGKGYHIVVAQWCEDERSPQQIWRERGVCFSGWYQDDDSDEPLPFLTHWMPLPPPPGGE
jgi:hypothetical protein